MRRFREVVRFLRGETAAVEVGELAREPVRSRGAGISQDPDWDPGHLVDVSDDLTIHGGPPLASRPATREDCVMPVGREVFPDVSGLI